MNLIDFDSFDFANPSMKLAIARLKNASQQSKNVLIFGEAGVGKSTLALFCHHLRFAAQSIVFVEAQALYSSSLIAELAARKIKTLVIENIDQLNPNHQQRFLTDLRSINLQVIATTRLLSLESLQKAGLEIELIEALNSVSVLVPSLAERREDMLEIVNFMLDVFCILYGSEKKTLTDKAIAEMCDYSWPGNIRELELVLEKAYSQSVERVIRPEELKLGSKISGNLLGDLAGMSLSEVEKCLILQTLELTKNNKSKAAQLLGISIRTLRNKLTEYKESGVLL